MKIINELIDLDESDRAKLRHLKEMLMFEINFFNTLQSIYTEYPEGYTQVLSHSKRQIESIMVMINEKLQEHGNGQSKT